MMGIPRSERRLLSQDRTSHLRTSYSSSWPKTWETLLRVSLSGSGRRKRQI